MIKSSLDKVDKEKSLRSVLIEFKSIIKIRNVLLKNQDVLFNDYVESKSTQNIPLEKQIVVYLSFLYIYKEYIKKAWNIL